MLSAVTTTADTHATLASVNNAIEHRFGRMVSLVSAFKNCFHARRMAAICTNIPTAIVTQIFGLHQIPETT